MAKELTEKLALSPASTDEGSPLPPTEVVVSVQIEDVRMETPVYEVIETIVPKVEEKITKIEPEMNKVEIPETKIHQSTIQYSSTAADQSLTEQLQFEEDLSCKFTEIVTNRANYRVDCSAETVSMIRGSSGSGNGSSGIVGGSCSKDTILFIDQQGHSLIDDEDSLLSNRSLWVGF